MSRLPRIGITVGDPAGIGPEIAVKAAADPRVREVCEPVLYGPHTDRGLASVSRRAALGRRRSRRVRRDRRRRRRREAAGRSTRSRPRRSTRRRFALGGPAVERAHRSARAPDGHAARRDDVLRRGAARRAGDDSRAARRRARTADAASSSTSSSTSRRASCRGSACPRRASRSPGSIRTPASTA